MKHINWNTEKSMKLKELRGICFEDVIYYIEKGDILHDYEHPNQKRYSGQRIMVIGINNYAYLVPYVEDEEEILDGFEKGEWVPVKNLSKRKAELMKYARNTLKKDKRLNIRISERDLNELQRKALIEGLPYQTYVSSIIHKFVNGKLIEAKN
jgi:predicted DNA binding CopG/RHH family protein